ncbi:MAG: hypothetical protein ACWIPI_05605, partial [Polaribacter sp.]
MRILLMCCGFLFFASCDYLSIKEKEKTTSKVVAIVNTDKLFKEDLEGILPKDISKEDSLVLVKSYIQDWAIKKLLLKKAENNNSSASLQEITDLVENYRQSLLINNYKEKLIKQKLDTIISEDEITNYYKMNKDIFKLNEVLVKAKYLSFNEELKDKKKIIALFKSDKMEDQEKLEKEQLSFKTYQLNDSVWVKLDKILLKVPFSREKLLKKTKFLEKQDSLGLYLAAIKDV